MKIDKLLKDLTTRLTAVSGSSNDNNEITSRDDHDYLAVGSEPPRFAYYRQDRIERSNDEWRKKTFEAAYDSITQDELDFCLKKKLREPPEQRYQHNKMNWFFHESSYSMRGLDAYDGKRCNGFTGYIPECRYYPEYGRIEVAEVITEHRELEAEYRKQNKVVNIDISANDDNYNDYQKFMKWNNMT